MTTQMHPAREAWDTFRRTRPELHDPTDVATIKAKAKRAGVYRLSDASASGQAVIAKRCRWPVARIEQTLYQQVLSRLALPHLEFYGVVADPTPEFAWVFLEDAGAERYDPSDLEARRLAARWLAAMHLASRDLIGVCCLPDRSAASYLAQVGRIREAIQNSSTNPAFGLDDRRQLAAISDQLDSIQRQWGRIEAACDALPSVLVHGDLAAKNAHVRVTELGTQFLVLDWETAGWGVPAADLCQLEGKPVRPDLETYWSIWAESGHGVSRDQIDELAWAGGIFRMITSMHWASLWLAFESVERAMSCLTSYRECLSALLDESRWAIRAS